MVKIILLTAIAIMCFWVASLIKVPKNKQKTKFRDQSVGNGSSDTPSLSIKLLNRDGDLQKDEWHTYIAGLPHHASKSDIGGFCGYVANEPRNTYDKNAMAIYSNTNLLGYIPAKELSDYRNWSGADVMPCIGLVYIEDGNIRGRVKILRPCNLEFLQQGFEYYINWIDRNFGPEYLPQNITWNFDKDTVV